MDESPEGAKVGNAVGCTAHSRIISSISSSDSRHWRETLWPGNRPARSWSASHRSVHGMAAAASVRFLRIMPPTSVWKLLSGVDSTLACFTVRNRRTADLRTAPKNLSSTITRPGNNGLALKFRHESPGHTLPGLGNPGHALPELDKKQNVISITPSKSVALTYFLDQGLANNVGHHLAVSDPDGRNGSRWSGSSGRPLLAA
jgi:hypothetical protein